MSPSKARFFSSVAKGGMKRSSSGTIGYGSGFSIDAIARDLASAQIGENVLSDPYFAEAIGAALAEAPVGGNIINNIRRTNPLALFHALRMFKQPANESQRAIVAAMESWLSETATHLPANNQLRWAALEALAETESPLVLSIVSRFSDLHWASFRARFRNGDLIGGIELCRSVEPGVRMRGHEIGRCSTFMRSMDRPLSNHFVPSFKRTAHPRFGSGAVRLAGHLADANRAGAIEASWAIELGA